MKFACFNLVCALIAAASLLQGCGATSDKPGFGVMHHMEDSQAVKAQRLGPSGEPMRVPVEGTVSRTTESYPYEDVEVAGRENKNPLPKTKEVLARGQKLYNTYCIVCHGSRGEGNGSVVPKFPQPPSLQSDKIKGWPDGKIYHVITVGQNLMSNYASQLEPSERWAVIHYIRALQRSVNPTDEDVRDLEARKRR